MTNFSQLHRETLAGWFAKGGLPIDPDRIITGTSATAAHTAATHAGRPLFVLAADDARREFDGQTCSPPTRPTRAPPGTVAAVVIGDAGDELSYRNLDVAFRLVRGGAELLAMHRNPWWLTPKGETLDAGGVRRRARVRDRRSGRTSSASRRRRSSARRSPGLTRRPRRAAPAFGVRDGRRRPARRRRRRAAGRPAGDPRAVGQDRRGRGRAARDGAARGPDGIGATLADVVAALD